MSKEKLLSDEELRVADIISHLLKSGYIKIGVNIVPQHAQKGSGQWNITKVYAQIGDEYIELDEGNIEMIEER